MGELIPMTGRPDYQLRVVADETPGCVRIEAVNVHGVVEDELWCTRDQARALAPLLEQL